MRKLLIFLLTAILVVIGACSQKNSENFVFVKGGTFKNTKSNFYNKNVTISNFIIGKYEVTQKEWIEVMGSNPSEFIGDNLPVEMVSWYDCVEYCNKRSIKEGLNPYYTIDKNKKDLDNENDLDDIKWTVTINTKANGYRLPTEAEWEYAAEGGQKSKNFIYSGSNYIDEVAWYWKNSGDQYLTGEWHWLKIKNNNNKSKPIGSKNPNELGLYDMSGNVREWCWDRYGNLESNGTVTNGKSSEFGRVWKGGGWLGADFCCEPAFRINLEANSMGADQGFRVCRSM